VIERFNKTKQMQLFALNSAFTILQKLHLIIITCYSSI